MSAPRNPVEPLVRQQQFYLPLYINFNRHGRTTACTGIMLEHTGLRNDLYSRVSSGTTSIANSGSVGDKDWYYKKFDGSQYTFTII